MEVPFHKPLIEDDDLDQVTETIRNGWLTMGSKTIQFEEEFKKKVDATYAVALSSCTAAMHLALKVIDLRPGDEVIIPSMTFTATGEVIRYFSAMPIIADVDLDTHNILPEQIERHLSNKTKAIIPVHFGGQPANMDEIISITQPKNIKIIEDAAHCFPSYYKDKPIGTIGDITAFSFYATKTIAVGEGGMATTLYKEYADKMRILRLHGINCDAWKRYTQNGYWYYEVIDAGFKYNMTDIQASLGLTQLKKSDEMWQKRERIAKIYNETFSNLDQIIIPKILPDRQTSWHLYVIKLNLESLTINRNRFIEELRAKDIGTSVHFIPLYRHPYYQKVSPVSYDKMPNSEWLYHRIISLPIFPGMNDNEIEYVTDNVKKIAEKYKR